MIRTLIAEDEALARRRLRKLLSTENDVVVVGECRDGRETIAAIHERQPDLLFLDVEMPEVSGLGVVEAITPERMPPVIFVTAYDHYAVQAFDANAVDYLLKPFDEDRFNRALNRARRYLSHVSHRDHTNRLQSVLSEVKQGTGRMDRLVIKSGGRIVFLDDEEVDWIEAAANYVRLHAGSNSYLLRQTMNVLESKLDPERYMRIHRSIIVNIDKIRELKPCNNGEYIVVLRTGKELSLSRSFRDRIQQLLSRLSLAADDSPLLDNETHLPQRLQRS
jgi:two-component system LytT family response regulator